MSARTQEIFEEASASLSPEETRALAEMLFELYEEEMDAREAEEAIQRYDNGQDAGISHEDLLAKLKQTAT